MKLHIMQFSPAPYYVTRLGSKYSPQHPVLCSSLNVRDQDIHPYKTRGKIIIPNILTFTFLGSRREDTRALHYEIAAVPYSTAKYKHNRGSTVHWLPVGVRTSPDVRIYEQIICMRRKPQSLGRHFLCEGCTASKNKGATSYLWYLSAGHIIHITFFRYLPYNHQIHEAKAHEWELDP
jgi:hypothetical protein